MAIPEKPVDHNKMLSKEEYQKIIFDWNDTAVEYPHDRCVHQLFEEQVTRTPDAVAVVFETQNLTYTELNKKANQLAHYLKKKGVGVEVLVGLCMTRSLEMIISLLAILKAGGAYVPLEPDYPIERLSFVLKDTNVPILLTLSSISDVLPEHGAEIIYLDNDWEMIAKEDKSNLVSDVNTINLAYVIYTSGSTGTPKGVMIQHSGLVNRLMWEQDRYQLEKNDVVLQKATYSFDISVWELFWPLIVGSRLVFARPGGHRDNQYLIDFINKQKVTIIHFVPSMLQAMVDTPGFGRCTSLKRVLCGGEILPVKLAKAFTEIFAATTGIPLYNQYGPTEATIDVSSYRITGDENTLTIPIGTPVANTQLYILDKNNRPVPVGSTGELHIGGVQLARGYLNRPELTAEKFIRNPFSDEPDSRLYKTGDKVRYLPDGNIEFLGRLDHQIKLRGVRIELGEIEAALMQHPAIDNAVVILREDHPGDKRIVAYLTAEHDLPDVAELQTFLRQKLPDYMLPSAYVVLSEFPLMPNGKMDRKALMESELSRTEDSEHYVAPRSPVEEILAQSWSEVLHLEHIGVHDDFFEQGGDSLLAMQLVVHMGKNFDTELPVHILFEQPTIAQMGAYLEALFKQETAPPLKPIEAISRTHPIVASFAQQRLWFLDQLMGASSTYNIPWATRLKGTLDIQALRQSINAIVQRHEVLRTCFSRQADAPTPLQIIQPALQIDCPLIDLQSLPETSRETEAQRLIHQEGEKTFDLERGPLLRALLVKLTEDEHILLVTIHHIVVDGWSLSILSQELNALYTAFSQDLSSPLTELPIQYADYAVWQRSQLQGEILDKLLAYWKRQLADLTPLELPTDHPRPAEQSYRGDTEPLVLSAELTRSLKALSQHQGVTLYMTLLAALQILLHRYSGQDDISVGGVIAGRNHQQIEGLIGFFVNTLLMRNQLSGNLTFQQLLKKVQTSCLEAYAHQELPFEKVVSELQPQRDMSRHPLFQVILVLQNTPQNTLQLPGLSTENIIVNHKNAMFDISISLEEKESGLTGSIEFATDLFNRETIQRLAGHYEILLQGIVADIETPIAELPLLTSAEQQILVQWNDTRVDYPRDQCLHQLFENQVAKLPDAIAVVFEEQQLTYNELNTKANQVAHYLLAKMDTGNPTRLPHSRLIGIAVERSLDMIIGLLAILKSGGAYVPIDPGYPAARIRYMLEDSGSKLLITQKVLKESLPLGDDIQVLSLDDVASTSPIEARNPEQRVEPTDLAYVIYTSGSTGRPKGVMVEHHGLINLVFAQREAFGIDLQARVLQFASISFDASIWEIAMALANGATLVLPPTGKLVPDAEFANWLHAQKISHATLPPAVLGAMPVVALPRLKTLIVAGEVCPADLLQRWALGRDFINAYGPTECSVCATVAHCRVDEDSAPIGYPIANTRVYVLDRAGQLLPVGVPGELCIGGAGLARGYLNRPELTAKKFIEITLFGKTDRIYKTGDLVRWLPDGNLEYLGRIDQQIKLRGFRIEPGEIETTLTQHSSIKESVVSLYEADGNKRLVAYVLLEDRNKTRDTLIAELRDWLENRLPEYMLPANFVVLDKLPLTPNGKIDRKALPAPAPHFTSAYEAPRNDIEQQLAQIFCSLLKQNDIGIHDNFFDRGGDSLLAVQLATRISEEFNKNFPVQGVFKQPTIVQLGHYLEAPLKQAIATAFNPIETISRAHPIAASFAQQRLWFLDQLMGASSTYNIHWATRLKGPLDIQALQQSINAIVQRHEVLRTCFAGQDGLPVQVVLPSLLIECPLIELQSLSGTEREAEALRVADREAGVCFDLARGPLLRVLLIKLDEEDHILLLTIHHIVMDGWSFAILSQELTVLYIAIVQGLPSPLAELPLQYADYAVWQRSQLHGEILEKLLTYWKKQLADITPQEFPTDYPRPAEQTYRGSRVPLVLSTALTRSLKALGKTQGVTLYMTLLAALQVLLHRYSGQDDICVGSAIAGRDHQQIKGLIGFFVNTLVMRTQLSSNQSFQQLLKKVQVTCLDAYAHQELPFEKLVSELQPQRDMSRHPLFQVMLVLQNTPHETLELPGVVTESLTVAHESAKFDLLISLEETADGISGDIEYASDLFNRETIQRLARHFETLLRGIVADIETPIAKLQILTQKEQYRLLEEWNDTAVDYPCDQCVHQLFEAQAVRTPDGVAIVFSDQSLTYRQLNERANQLAHYLQDRGVMQDTLVGIAMDKSLELVVGLLGILKAGGAYVPLDLSYPQERLRFMTQDADLSLLLGLSPSMSALNFYSGQVLCLDKLDTELDACSKENLKNLVTSDNRAYVIYTSGSTGKPKGVEVRHYSINRLVFNTDYAHFDGQQNFLLLAPVSFDASTFELWGALLHGARCIIYPERVPDFDTLESYIHDYHISILWLTASLFNTIVEQRPKLLAPVSQILTGGEALSVKHIRQAQELLPDSQIINGYGPTENTTFTCCYAIPKALSTELTSIPIGKPIANTQTYILDEALQPVPVGVSGELYIGGDGLARGYLNHPELTTEKFIHNPFSDDPGSRLYQTGDKVRYLPDGNIEFLGRLDQQVKLRGHRIELGEIEATLIQHQAVHSALVILREDRPGDKRLVAYLQSDDKSLGATELRSFLKQSLPDYMLPSALVTLEAFPLTSNGKLDRAALPAPGLLCVDDSKHYVAPRSPLEEILAGLWSDLLNLEHVSIHDNFFEQGGDSLLAVQLVVQTGKQFNIELPVRVLFEQPTIAQLGHYLEALLKQETAISLKPIETVSRAHPIAASFAQQRLWFLDQLMGVSSTYNIPWATRMKGSLNIQALQQSINAIVQRHEVLRTCFAEQDGLPVQVIVPSLQIDCPLMDLQSLPKSEREVEAQRLMDREAESCFDLTQGSLLHTILIKLSQEEHILLITIHHIVADGWSLAILSQELTALYTAIMQGLPSPLAELPLQYTDYAVWQRSQLHGEILEKLLTYWKKQLADITPQEFPTEYPRPAEQSYRGATEPLLLSAELTRSLKILSQHQGVTLYMTLLAALQVLLHRYSGQADICVGSAIAGRDHQQIEGLIGFFVNTLVMRTQLSGNLTFKQLLKKVQTTCLEAYAHQELPFEKLVSELQPQRDMSRHPLFQVMLVLQNTPHETLKLPGLVTENLTVAHESAKFDLLISLEEKEGGLIGDIEYATDLFRRETVQRLLGNYETLLQGIVADIETPIAKLQILTQKEQYRLLEEWNDTAVGYPRDRCVHQLFEAQAVRTPDAVAIVFNDQSLTYRQLNERANRLAHHLGDCGVGPDALVGIGMDKSLELVMGMLAILKAGGAYVPLDLSYPQERLRCMTQDAGLSLLLGLSSSMSALDFYSGQLLCLDKLDAELEACSHENPNRSVASDSRAYVMYTSGSTGQPKGVEVRHYSINRLLFNTDYAHFDGQQNFLLLAPVSFDASTFELWGALLHGARCIIYPERVPDFDTLERYIHDYHISILWLTASLFNTIVEQRPTLLAPVSQILTGGEALSVKHIRQAQELLPDSQIINGYGPTENTTFTCCYAIPKTLSAKLASIPIGKPIANTQTYILDKILQPVTVGVAGELYIGGDGLARGYLNQPELTAEKFIPNPFSDDPDSRLYKTGDKVRYLPDGNIVFLGRLDQQVKLRGFRIELGEIEAALMQHSAINNAVVTLREDRPGDKRLVAYVTADPELPDTAELRTFLGETLPEYMLPSAFVTLEAFPLTPNGKLDRAALPAPELSRGEESERYVAPRSPIEEMLADLWADLLNLERVGIHDNFFEQGGDSLLAVQLATHISEALNKNFPVEGVFRHPTIKSQVELLQDFTPAEFKTLTDNILTPVRSSGPKTPLFWLFGGSVVPSIYNHIDSERPFYFLNHQTLADGKPARHTDIKSMAKYYLEIIQAIEPEGPYILGGFSIGGLIAYEMAQQLHQNNKSVQLLFLLGPSPPGKEFNQEILKRLPLLEQKRRLINPGYKAYFADLISRYNSSIRKYIIKFAMPYYLKRNKPLPIWLRSNYIHKIYNKSLDHYQPSHTPLAINKTILIYEKEFLTENNFYRQQWKKVCKGELEFFTFDLNHVELIKTSGSSKWLKILSNALDACT